MSKITKKSVNELMKIYDKNCVDTFILNLQNPQDENAVIMEIPVKNSLTIAEKGLFVDRVVNGCFNSDGEYLPQYLDPVFMITLLQMTTKVPVFEKDVEGDDGETFSAVDIGRTYELCKAINLPVSGKDETYQALISELRGMVIDKLEYMKQIRIRKSTSVSSLLQPAFDELKGLLSSIDVNELLTQLESMLPADNNVVEVPNKS